MGTGRSARGPARANPSPARCSVLVKSLNSYVLGPSKKRWPARDQPDPNRSIPYLTDWQIHRLYVADWSKSYRSNSYGHVS